MTASSKPEAQTATPPATPPRIPFLDFHRQDPVVAVEVEAAIARVLKSGWYILGPEVEAFEREWALACGARGAVGVANGTEAITIALLAAGAVEPQRGDEVITSALTAGYTALAILRAGAVPVFADVDPKSGLVTAETLEREITPRTRALLPVHLYGQMVDLEAIGELARARGLTLVEDACQAHAASLDGTLLGDPAGKRAGAIARAGAHSFYPTKNLGAIGDGGAIVADDPEVLAKARVLRYGGQARTYWHSDPLGVNSRLDELQAAILRSKLKQLAQATAERRRQAHRYLAQLGPTGFQTGLEIAQPLGPTRHAYHLFVVRSPDRDRLRRELQARGIQTLVHYPHALHQQPAFVAGARRPLPHAEALAGSVFSLPLYPGFGDREQDEVISALAELSA
jgi:dTDP-3-amino-3,4,6-trideoxy-alpha-D-glucose transaminase